MNQTLSTGFTLIYNFLQRVKGPIRRMDEDFADPIQVSGALEICVYGGKNPKCFGATILRHKEETDPLFLVFSESAIPKESGLNVNKIWMHVMKIPDGCRLPEHHSNPTEISEALRNWLIGKIVRGKNPEDRLVEWVKVPYTIERKVTLEFAP